MTFAIQITMYIFCLLNVITKMLNTFFGELYLIVNNSSDHKNMRNCRVCPQVMNKKIIFAFNVVMLILLFLMLHIENISRELRFMPSYPKSFWWPLTFFYSAPSKKHIIPTRILFQPLQEIFIHFMQRMWLPNIKNDARLTLP